MTLLLLILVLVGVGVAVLLATADRPRRQIRVIRDPDDRIDMLPPERTRRVRDERVERRRIIDS
jgi:hypothetical protein